jgi:hypothetical protein
MRFSWLILLCLSFPFISLAQGDVISGKITRKDSKSPIAGASVFLSNSSFGTATASDGTFVLRGVRPGQYTLVVTLIGLEDYTQTILVSKNPIQLNIDMKSRSIMLRDVQITTPTDWRKNYEKFKGQFIGADENAKSCLVMNPEILSFNYYSTQKKLEAFADNFLIVENRALGYRVKFLVRDFVFDAIAGIVSYSGQRLFEELPGTKAKKKKWAIARNFSYYGSEMHFLRSLYKDRLPEEGFEIHRYFRLPNEERPPEDVIERNVDRFIKQGKRDSANRWIEYENMSRYSHEIYYHEQLFLSQILGRSEQPGIFVLAFPDYLCVQYTKKRDNKRGKEIYLPLDVPNYETTILSYIGKQRAAFFDMNGVIITGAPLNEGTWAKSRLSQLLPVDYVPADDVDNNTNN